MKPLLLSLALALPASPAAAAAQYLLQSPGSECQPTLPTHASYLDYAEGAANASGSLDVTCPLPAIPPGHVQVAVRVYLLDFDRRWGGKCRAHNAWPALAPEPAMIAAPGAPHIGIAEWKIDPYKWVPHSVICPLQPGQTLYSLEVVLEPQ